MAGGVSVSKRAYNNSQAPNAFGNTNWGKYRKALGISIMAIITAIISTISGITARNALGMETSPICVAISKQIPYGE
ncbi:hypothetical protein HORIV_17600 [Vreelandella olivaria]|uniref:Uncharacterized protein n=1 Tax=Vreelandella olivaria TaxID=390919 RepID=A0ABN5WQS6_9GAMM|nr:hypothetical protein HORIV_17600 [Halomonas olivaria]